MLGEPGIQTTTLSSSDFQASLQGLNLTGHATRPGSDEPLDYVREQPKLDFRDFLNTLLSVLPELSPKLPDMVVTWCKTNDARIAGVIGCIVQTGGGPPKASIAWIMLSPDILLGSIFEFPTHSLLRFILNNSNLPINKIAPVAEKFRLAWEKQPNVFRNYIVKSPQNARITRATTKLWIAPGPTPDDRKVGESWAKNSIPTVIGVVDQITPAQLNFTILTDGWGGPVSLEPSGLTRRALEEAMKSKSVVFLDSPDSVWQIHSARNTNGYLVVELSKAS